MRRTGRPRSAAPASAAPSISPALGCRRTPSGAATGWSSPELHAPTDRLDVRLRLLASEGQPLKHWSPVHVHLGAAHVMGRVALLEGDKLAPGDAALAQLVLEEKVGALAGDRVILRDPSATARWRAPP